MAQPGFPVAPTTGKPVNKPDEAAHHSWAQRIAEVLNRTIQGKTNNVLPITLTAGVASTDIIDARIGGYSALVLQPLTANAAAALATSPYVLASGQKNGQVTLGHANNAETDRTFNLVIIG